MMKCRHIPVAVKLVAHVAEWRLSVKVNKSDMHGGRCVSQAADLFFKLCLVYKETKNPVTFGSGWHLQATVKSVIICSVNWWQRACDIQMKTCHSQEGPNASGRVCRTWPGPVRGREIPQTPAHCYPSSSRFSSRLPDRPGLSAPLRAEWPSGTVGPKALMLILTLIDDLDKSRQS